jgi:hypothetical protein
MRRASSPMSCCTPKSCDYTKADGRPAPPPTGVVADWTGLHWTCMVCTLHMISIQIYRECGSHWGCMEYYVGSQLAIDVHTRAALLYVYPVMIILMVMLTIRQYVKDLRLERDELAEQALYLTKVDSRLHVIGGGDSDEDNV